MLLTTYNDANKVTNSLLAVRYTTEFYEDGYYFRLTRTAKKSYAYVGMTRSAAEACRLAKIAQYTRNCCREDGENPVTDPDGRTHPGVVQELVCVASVSATRDHDDSWRCDIEVDESDYLAVKDAPVDAITPFAQYVEWRDYDEQRPGLKIVSIASATAEGGQYARITVTNNGITNLNLNEIICETKSSAAASSWATATVSISLSTVALLMIEGEPANGMVYRLKARNYVSPAMVYTAP